MILISLQTQNAAFSNDCSGEVTRILRNLADEIENSGEADCDRALRDGNGNKVGEMIVAGEAELLTGQEALDAAVDVIIAKSSNKA